MHIVDINRIAYIYMSNIDPALIAMHFPTTLAYIDHVWNRLYIRMTLSVPSQARKEINRIGARS